MIEFISIGIRVVALLFAVFSVGAGIKSIQATNKQIKEKTELHEREHNHEEMVG